MSKKILIIKLRALGDVIMAFPYFAFIRSQYPDSHITLLTRPRNLNFIEFCPWFDEVITDEGIGANDPFTLFKMRRTIARKKFSIIYDFQKSRRSKRYLFLIRPKPSDFPDIPKNFSVDSGWAAQSDIQKFKLQKPYVVIIPGSSPRRAIKRWSAENYGAFCVFLTKQGLQPVICGGEPERAVAEEILHHCPTATDLTGSTDIMEASAVIGSAEAVISNDTALMHMSIALKKPTIALLSDYSERILVGDKPPHVQALRVDSMENLTIEQVIATFKSHLSR